MTTMGKSETMLFAKIDALQQIARFLRLGENRLVILTTGPRARIFPDMGRVVLTESQIRGLAEVPEKEVTDYDEAVRLFGDAWAKKALAAGTVTKNVTP